MDFIKKQSAGFYITVLTVILAVAGVAFYLINCKTAYFRNLGVDKGLVACMILAIVLELALIVGSQILGAKIYLDILPVASAVLFVVALVIFISLRVNSIAAIMTFENNAQTMADLSSAITGMVLCLLAALFGIIASFFNIVKDK